MMRSERREGRGGATDAIARIVAGKLADTLGAIVTRLNRAVADTVDAPDTKQHLLNVGGEPASNTPEEFDKFIRDQLALHRRDRKSVV